MHERKVGKAASLEAELDGELGYDLTDLSATEVLQRLDGQVRRGQIEALLPRSTGFPPLDRYLDGGFRPGELILIGGAPGVGKTTLALQLARNLAAEATGACAYVCYEHAESFLLQRLISLESFLARQRGGPDPLSLVDVRHLSLAAGRASVGQNAAGLIAALEGQPASAAALERLEAFGRRLYLLKASGEETGTAEMKRLVRELKARHGPRVTLFVDYLQKAPVFPAAPDEAERTTRVASELKDLALGEDVPIIAVAAANHEGLRTQRMRMYHLRGSSALTYEADVILILNNKYRIIAKSAISYNVYQAREFRTWVVCTIEKNRSGLELIDLEFQAYFASAGFEPAGRIAMEALVDERFTEW